MFDILIPFLMYTIVICGFIYFVFPRQAKNAIYFIIPKYRREYVVVHLRKIASQKILIYFVIPDKKTLFGEIAGGQYDLKPGNALPSIPIFKKRLHYLVNEGDSTPRKAKLEEFEDTAMFTYKGKVFFRKAVEVEEKETNVADRKQWAFRINAAFKSIAYDFLYGEKRQWAFIIACAAVVISIIALLYAISAINEIKPLVQVIYQQTIVGNESIVIRRP